MVDALKIAAKVALIVVITAGILAIFSTLQIPALDYTYITNSLGVGLAVLYHWIPVASIIVPIIFTVIGIRVAILGFEIGAIAWRWIMKVNE